MLRAINASVFRLTDAFSKKVQNLGHAVAPHFMHYNLYARVHLSLGGETPAMASGVADHVWPIPEITGLLDSNRPATNEYNSLFLIYPSDILACGDFPI